MLLEQYYQTASKNLKRFLMKSNIRITIFLGIQIVRNHIPKNLDNRSNVDSLAVYGLLSYDKYLSSFSQILIHTRFNNYPTQTDIVELASPQQLKSLNRDVKYRLKLIRNHYTIPETSRQTHVPRQQPNLDFPKALPTSLRPAFSYISCNSNPSSNHKAPRHSFFQFS